MKKTFALIAALALIEIFPVHAEELEVSTYYPVPSGVYQTLTSTGETRLATDDERQIVIGEGNPINFAKLTVFHDSPNRKAAIEAHGRAGGIYAYATGNDPGSYGVDASSNDIGIRTTGTNYDLYTTSAAGKSYFAGKVGIGVLSPNEGLELAGSLRLPTTTSTAGIIKLGANRWIHSYGTNNFFAGENAGNFSLSSDRNTAVGANSLTALSSGGYNTAVGYMAGQNIAGGSDNVAFGAHALNANVSGFSNTAVGRSSMQNVTGSENTGVGVQALVSTTGTQNTGLGGDTLNQNVAGSRNTAVGFRAGSTNASVGGVANVDGNDNTFVGHFAGGTSASLTNATAIGAKAVVSANNSLVLGSAANVGIGTSSPTTAKLDVTQSNQNTMALKVTSAGSSGFPYSNAAKIEITNNSSDAKALYATTNGTGNAGYFENSLATNSSPALRAFISTSTANSGWVADFTRPNAGILLNFYQGATGQGTISVNGSTVSYNPFTGSHYAMTDQILDKGMLVTMTGINAQANKKVESELVYGVVKSTLANDPKIMGAYLAPISLGDPDSLENLQLIMAVGNGEMWVADNGENISAGDYLISSSVEGHAMKDKGDYDIAYIIARAAEPIDWSSVTDEVNGTKHKKISIFFENFTRNGKADKLEASLEKIQSEMEALKAEVETLKKGG